jgi:hypothetical protein
MNDDAVAKITMLRDSSRCFVYGLISLLPGIGLPFAVLSLWYAGKVRVQEKKYWNAAGPYRLAGVLITIGGLVLWLVVVAIIIYNSIPDGGGISSLSGDD